MARGPTQKQLYDALEARFGTAIADAFEAAVDNLKASVDLQAAIRAVQAANEADLLAALNLDAAVFNDLLAQVEGAYAASGTVAANGLPVLQTAAGLRFVFRFNVRNPQAEAWLKDHSSTLVTRIMDDQRTAVREALAAGLSRGANPTTTALDIVGRMDRASGARTGGVIGLTAQQAGYVRNARDELASGSDDDFSSYLSRALRDKRFDRAVAKAQRTGEAIPADVQRKAVVAYERRLLKHRGDMIGRTETLTALRTAKHEAFRQAVESGAVNEADVERIWRSAGDSHVRHTHQVLNGQKQPGLSAPFHSPSGARMLFPGDTSLGAPGSEIIACRCDVSYRIDFLGRLS